MRLRFASIPLLLAALASGCSGEAQPERPSDPGVKLPPPALSPDQQSQLDAIKAEQQASAGMTPEDFAKKYTPSFGAAISYDPTKATGLDLVQKTALALNANELAALGKNGFVISENRKFPSFVYGYDSLYSMDLPLYVSADSILFAVHKSYDSILESVEIASLMPELAKMLASMRGRLGAGGASSFSAEARADADLLLDVALALLNDQTPEPVAGASASQIAELVAAAKAHDGVKSVNIFGTARAIDFSQFTPRGHYTDSPELTRYFRAMMWLGRTDLRILETQEDGSQIFRRRQLEGAFVLRDLADQDALARYNRIDSAIGAFVGENDYMTLTQVDGLTKDLGLNSPADLAKIPDAKIAEVVVQKGYGTQRIASAVMVNGMPDGGTLPLSSSFALLGQRYVVDSHVFTNVTYSRVQGGKVYRMMPNPLDVGFAALANDQAGTLLQPELQKYGYAPDLHMMRVLVDTHPDTFWEGNMYNRWLGALRTLSPASASGTPEGLPEVAKTEAWGRRLMNTQLASWAELRHDTILYAKQSYTDGAGCYFPDAYVDPYPAFYEAVGKLAEHGSKLVDVLDLSGNPGLGQNITNYFTTLRNVSSTLRAMAENERAGQPHTAEQMAFINQAVHMQFGCGSPWADGWYAQLFFNVGESIEFDPTIADVHTQPTDENGNPVGKVLHVGTGQTRMMVVTTEGCGTPKAYVGLASSYFEKTTENFLRLDDKQWATAVEQATPADVPWMQDIVPR
jgi:hypothetical protein